MTHLTSKKFWSGWNVFFILPSFPFIFPPNSIPFFAIIVESPKTGGSGSTPDCGRPIRIWLQIAECRLFQFVDDVQRLCWHSPFPGNRQTDWLSSNQINPRLPSNFSRELPQFWVICLDWLVDWSMTRWKHTFECCWGWPQRRANYKDSTMEWKVGMKKMEMNWKMMGKFLIRQFAIFPPPIARLFRLCPVEEGILPISSRIRQYFSFDFGPGIGIGPRGNGRFAFGCRIHRTNSKAICKKLAAIWRN